MANGCGSITGQQNGHETRPRKFDIGSLHLAAQACGGDLVRGSGICRVARVCTDSRQTQRGDLFFALRGERFDGHLFLQDAVAKGATAVVIENGRADLNGEQLELPSDRARVANHSSGSNGRRADGLARCVVPDNCGVVVVENARRALGRLAAWHRDAYALSVVAVAGSNGKTTTKELLASVLRQKLRTLWSEASFNNDIGVPLTLLNLNDSHQAAVLEVGTNHPGELEPLLRMVRPDFGVLTSIGREHLEFFGDLDGVAREEGQLAESLPAGGKLFIAGDNPWTRAIAKRARAAVVRAGFSDANDWRARDLRYDKGGLTFRVEGPFPHLAGEYSTRLLGRHQAVNALLALAVGAELGLDRAQLQQGLAECEAAKMRLQLWELKGVWILDDAYNANADSMVAGLETLMELPCNGRRVAVLGQMSELGTHSEAAHEEVGRRAAEMGVGQLFIVGAMAPAVGRGARSAGLHRVLEFAELEPAAAAIRSFMREGDILLLKASRAARFERITEVLRANEATTPALGGTGLRPASCDEAPPPARNGHFVPSALKHSGAFGSGGKSETN